MENQVTFGQCLAAILSALDLKCSKMAKEINVDPSLIYKWLRDERVPAYDTLYIEMISQYIAGKVCNSYQMEAISDLLKMHGIEPPESKADIQNKIKAWLLEAQGYSLKLRKKAKAWNKNNAKVPGISGFLRKTEIHHQNSHDRHNLNNHEPAVIGDLFCSHEQISLIKGAREVMNATIKLLRQAHKEPKHNDEKILMTLYSEAIILFEDKDLRHKWIHALCDALNNGWRIILLIRMNHYNERTIKIIEALQALLSRGDLTLYYQKINENTYNMYELCIVPHAGALFCFSSKVGHPLDTAFWYHGKESIEALTAYYFQYLTFAQPLLKLYPSQKTIEFLKIYAEAEEAPGDKYVFKNELSTITMPLNLYEKYIKRNSLSAQEISYRKFLHSKRLETFEAQVKHYKFRDICFIESMERLVRSRNYLFDDYYLLESETIEQEDIVCHLENLISMLKRYDNYEIAFVSEKDFYDMTNTCWAIKGNLCVFIESLNESNHIKKNFIATEKNIVQAFNDYFAKTWRNIPRENKEKANTIRFLQSLINICRSDGGL